MKRIRWLIGVCVMFVTLFAVRAASAYELQTCFEVPRLNLYATSRASSCLVYSTAGSIYAVDKTRTITITAIDKDVAAIDIVVGLLDGTYPDTAVADMYYHAPEIAPSTNANSQLYWTFSYTFRQGGKYAFIFYPLDKDGDRITGQTASFTVTIPEKADSALNAEISRVLSLLDISDSYTAAVSIHDWIVSHASYDSAHVYYNPYDLICNGIGTCNGYARAFELMMDAAGYSTERMIGWSRVTGEQHAWNVALLAGSWYQFDLTWDDRGSSGMTHLYFALSDELMQVDHSYRCVAGGQSFIPCTSLDCNYYVASGAWVNCAASILAALQEQINSGFTELSAPLSTTPGSDFYLLNEIQARVFGTVISRGLPGYVWYHSPSGTPVQVSLSYAYLGLVGGVQKGEFTGTYTREQILTLPSGLTEIEEEAFAGVTARYVFVPETCERIGERAFAESGLWCVYLPAGLTDIAGSAFEDAPWLRVMVPAGSACANVVRYMPVTMATY